MRCPYCEGDFENIRLNSNAGKQVHVRKCNNCGGFWIEKMPTEGFETNSVLRFDQPIKNFSMKSFNLVCPVDESVLAESQFGNLPTGGRYWQCPECGGMFYGKGQLATFCQWHNEIRKTNHYFALSQMRATMGVILLAIGVTFTYATMLKSNVTLRANEINSIYEASPNIFALIMLGITYLAGTILSVLGRKRLMVYLGWVMIIICLFGFSLIVFGP